MCADTHAHQALEKSESFRRRWKKRRGFAGFESSENQCRLGLIREEPLNSVSQSKNGLMLEKLEIWEVSGCGHVSIPTRRAGNSMEKPFSPVKRKWSRLTGIPNWFYRKPFFLEISFTNRKDRNRTLFQGFPPNMVHLEHVLRCWKLEDVSPNHRSCLDILICMF